MILDKIICLSRPNRKENIEKIENELKKQKLNINFQQGIDGKNIDPSIKQKYKNIISPYLEWKENRKARLAIYLSHLLIWKTIENEKEYILIIEDDVQITSNLKEEINNIGVNINFEWDLLFLGHCGALNGNIQGDFTIAKKGHQKNTNHGMFAYIINPLSVTKLIKQVTPIFKMQNIDWILRDKYDKIKAVYLNKSIINHDYGIPSERKSIDKIKK